MTELSSPIAPRLSHSILRELHIRLRGSGYVSVMDIVRASPSQETVHSNSPLIILKRLFADRKSLDIHEATSALAPLDPLRLVEAGLLEQNDSQIRALFQIQAYDNLLFITDFMPRDHPADLVLPIGPSGRYLANVTIRDTVESALDLGCGCGIQALLMARHARRVTATDINPRALALTRINAEFNGFKNIEALEGSYFDPIHGRTFDLIAVNLPYVFSPESKYIYRDLRGNNHIRQTVEEMPRHLREGGYAHIMLNWTHRADQVWRQPIEEWIKSRNVDAWTLFSKSETPEQYAKSWILINEKEEPVQYKQTQDKWLDWFKSQNIERIASGLTTLRHRTSRSNWACSVHIHKIANEPLAIFIQRLFLNQDFLAQIREPCDLLGVNLRPVNLKVVSSPKIVTARTRRGFLIQTVINPMTAAALDHLDGTKSLHEAIQNSLGETSTSTNINELISKEIYHLMNLGMIEALE